MIEIQEIISIAELASLKEEWNGLLEKSRADTMFLKHEWLFTWWEVFGGSKKLFVLVARDEKRIVGIAPLMIEKSKIDLFPARAIKFLGGSDTDRSDFILDPDFGFVAEDIMDHIFKRREAWDIVWLQEIRKDSSTLPVLDGYASRNRVKTWQKTRSVCPYLVLPKRWDELWKKMDKTQRKHINNRNRRLEESGRVIFENYDGNADLDGVLNRAILLEKKSWKGSQHKGIFYDDGHRKFHERFAALSRKEGWFNISFLSLNANTICFAYGFKYKDKYLSYSTSFDPECSKYSPGNILKYHLLQRLIDENISEVDFLRGSQSHKLAWTSEAREQVQIMIFNRFAYPSLICAYQTKLKPVLKKAIQPIKTGMTKCI